MGQTTASYTLKISTGLAVENDRDYSLQIPSFYREMDAGFKFDRTETEIQEYHDVCRALHLK